MANLNKIQATLNEAPSSDINLLAVNGLEIQQVPISAIKTNSDNSSSGLAYTLSDDGTYYTVTGIGECTDTDIKIPPVYKGLPVKEIGSDAFYNCDNLVSVTIPDSVTSIGSSAFRDCSNLTSIVIPDSVTSIGYDAFRSCSSLESVVIGDSVTSIGHAAFYNCDSLTIYCEVDSQPSDWNSRWNIDNYPVVWGAAIDFAGVNDQLNDVNDQLNDVNNQLNSVRAETANMTSITYFELKSLRDNFELIPGMFYRIIDYVCTTSQENTRAMDNKFDIIVQALSANTLSETALADYHYEDGEPDGYFIKKVGTYDALISDAVTKYYDIYEDCGETEDKTADYKNTDKFIAYGYLANNEGVTVPVLYKTDMSYAEEDEEFTNPDYGDVFYYVGTYELDGTTYDKWRKIEEGDYGWDGTGKIYALTNVIVEDNTIIDSVIGGSAIVVPKAANIPAWELKYCLDNDTTRFAWASEGQAITNVESGHSNGQPLIRYPEFDGQLGAGNGYEYAWGTQADADDTDPMNFIYSKNPTLVDGEIVYNPDNGNLEAVQILEGKGVIYFMKDEHGNECPYDFKNIQFKRNISLENGYPKLDNQLEEEGADPTWVYTFCGTSYHIDNDEWSGLKDGSLESPYGHQNDDRGSTFHHNVMGEYRLFYDGDTEDYSICGKQYLNNNVFFGYWEEIGSTSPENCPYYYAMCCYDNKLGNNCSDNTFGNDCFNNTFGNGCFNNTFGNGCYNNIFGYNCSDNTFGNTCSGNIFGNTCYNNTLGHACGNNTFGYDCCNNTLGYACGNNIFGYNCSDNTFGYACKNNTFDIECINNTLDIECYNNTFGNYCNHNNFGSNCYNNIFGNTCYDNIFGNWCKNNTFGNDCYSNKMQVDNAQYVYVLSGINNKTLTPVPNANYQQIYKSSGTQEIILD
jgi:hypothetical protein